MLTHLGSAWATLGATAVAAAWLLSQRQRMEAGVLAATVVGGRLLNDGLKLLYDRPRPAFDAHPVLTSSSSFPSGHAANTMIAFVAIALALTPARHRALALNVAVIVAAAIGLSRPYLGVHWPSDVLGGWLLAAMVLLLSRIAQTSLCSPEEQHQVVGGHATPIDRG
ncbi:phosphatase PAP2 family protein [Sphingomonas rhizophila]|uniref:Phosphatase PAP2 family protein n=1 Tax=Sphingomonas rhizophila TaxID=2071607 RepID=A0A7G9SED2_9SPHN|nr:phosphatase PAP2 family protein [Sphingomonas rhizophila]